MNTNKNLEKVVKELEKAPVKNLQSEPWLIAMICKFGLVPENREPYGMYNVSMVPSRDICAIYQQPDQLAAALMVLSKIKIKSYLEVGTWTGGTFIFIREYLKRFGLVSSKCIDTFDYRSPQVKELTPEFEIATAYTVAGEWDLVHIDADHEYQAVKLDFNHLKNRAKIIMFHDINDATCPGPGQLWEEITKDQEDFLEITEHSNHEQIHGIGIFFNKWANIKYSEDAPTS